MVLRAHRHQPRNAQQVFRLSFRLFLQFFEHLPESWYQQTGKKNKSFSLILSTSQSSTICVPDYNVEWSGLADCISPNGSGPNINPWFDTQAKAWLDSLPEYDSNESALLDGLVVGEPYWAAFNHVAAAYGTFMRVTP